MHQQIEDWHLTISKAPQYNAVHMNYTGRKYRLIIACTVVIVFYKYCCTANYLRTSGTTSWRYNYSTAISHITHWNSHRHITSKHYWVSVYVNYDYIYTLTLVDTYECRTMSLSAAHYTTNNLKRSWKPTSNERCSFIETNQLASTLRLKNDVKFCR